jgi:hypothetical protein
VTVTVVITDYTPQDEFFLLQRRESPIAMPGERPTGATVAFAPGHVLIGPRRASEPGGAK